MIKSLNIKRDKAEGDKRFLVVVETELDGNAGEEIFARNSLEAKEIVRKEYERINDNQRDEECKFKIIKIKSCELTGDVEIYKNIKNKNYKKMEITDGLNYYKLNWLNPSWSSDDRLGRWEIESGCPDGEYILEMKNGFKGRCSVHQGELCISEWEVFSKPKTKQ